MEPALKNSARPRVQVKMSLSEPNLHHPQAIAVAKHCSIPKLPVHFVVLSPEYL